MLTGRADCFRGWGTQDETEYVEPLGGGAKFEHLILQADCVGARRAERCSNGVHTSALIVAKIGCERGSRAATARQNGLTTHTNSDNRLCGTP